MIGPVGILRLLLMWTFLRPRHIRSVVREWSGRVALVSVLYL